MITSLHKRSVLLCFFVLDIKALLSSFHVEELHFILLLIMLFFMVSLFEEFDASEKMSYFCVHLLLSVYY